VSRLDLWGLRIATVKRLIRRLVSFNFARLLGETARAERSGMGRIHVGPVVRY